jgi:hypothetical protein
MPLILLSLISLIIGYFLGRSHGLMAGYDQCREHTLKALDETFKKLEKKRNEQ